MSSFPRIKVIRHKTLEECAEAFACGREMFPLVGFETDGSPYRVDRETFFADMSELGRWAFCRPGRKRAEIHIWFKPDLTIEALLSVLAHEVGHITRPHYRGEAEEEAKAGEFATWAVFVYEIAQHLTGEHQEGAEYELEKWAAQ